MKMNFNGKVEQMSLYERVNKINNVLDEHFKSNFSNEEMPAKDYMNLFIKNGIYEKDIRNGLPLRKDLRKLDEMNELDRVKYLEIERKKINTFWYFKRGNK